jgi:hypothetical protein
MVSRIPSHPNPLPQEEEMGEGKQARMTDFEMASKL